MVEGDWTSSLPTLLRAKAPVTDLVLWDLCDERLGVRRLPSGHFVTRSVDSISSGIDALYEDCPLWRPGEPQHLQHFTRRAAKFCDFLTRWRLFDKTIVLAPAWAAATRSGLATPPSYGWYAEEANLTFEAYHQCLQDLGLPVLRLAAEEVWADPGHQWGLAPFHYDVEVYDRLSADVRALIR